jgi:hypothetical protein
MLLAPLCMSQQVIRTVKNSRNGDREVYYVLASDSSTLHGRYVRSERSSRTEGFYKNGLQDGVWTVYTTQPKKFIRVQGPFKDGKRSGLWSVYTSKKKLKTKGYFQNDQRIGFWRFYNGNGELEEEGNYNNDLRVGKWSFYDEKGNTVQEFDYTTKKVINDVSLVDMLQTPFRVIEGPDTTSHILQRPPLVIGGKARLSKSKIIQYPIKADSVKVEIRFVIDKYGRAFNHHIVESKGHPYDQEAMFTITQLPAIWLPAMLNGRTVEVEHTLTVKFSKVNLRTEPVTFYREVLRQSNIANPFDSYPTGRSKVVMYSNPGLSYQACKVQIL